MEEQTLQSRVREIVVDAFSVTKYDGPFDSLVAPTKNFGIRGTSTAEVFALRLAVGIDMDTTLVSKLGTHAHRDRICLGEPVETAAANEENCAGGKIGISKRVYEVLPERLSKHFAYNSGSSVELSILTVAKDVPYSWTSGSTSLVQVLTPAGFCQLVDHPF